MNVYVCRHILVCLLVLLARDCCVVRANSKSPLPGDVAINPQRQSYDTMPAMTRLPNGEAWTVWKSYLRGKERILGRSISKGLRPELGPVTELSDHPGIVHEPQIVGGNWGLWSFWTSRDAEHWQIIGRSRIGGHWQPIQALSDPAADSIGPHAIATARSHVVLCWSAYSGSQSQIWLRVWDGRTWHEKEAASDGRHPAYRPVLAVHKDEVWVIWDESSGIDSVIKGRRVLPSSGPIELISPAHLTGRRCLIPVALGSETCSLCVAWLKLTDIIGGEGVIDQLHTLQMAVRRDGAWRVMSDETGDTEAAYLVYGLLSDLRADRPYPSGYLGRRRHPLLLDDGDSVWLIWEQKSDHWGRGTETTGDLLGRRFHDGLWQQTVRFRHGLLDYRMVQPARTHNGQFEVLGSDVPRDWTRTYHRVTVDVAKAEPFTPQRWDDLYQPVQLPLEHDSPRHSITVGEKTYQLFWADMHCHGGFTADAEGEPDEILRYGRDRAKLDMMVLQDNDEIYHCFLTESEYWLDVLHSQHMTEPGRFLALPGYEWTQRVAEPGVPFDPFRSAYGPNGRSTFPNHRTVMYPLSAGPIVRYPEVGGNFQQFADTVEAAGGVLNTQHAIFVPTDRACETNMEVATGWGIYIHQSPKQFRKVLDDGYRLGFVGCSDSHRRNPGLCGGLTGIYAESLDDQPILEALRQHRCFATNGSKIILDARANGQLMGQDVIAHNGHVQLDLTAIGTQRVISATLIHRGTPLKTFAGDGTRTLTAHYEYKGLTKGTHWFYWEVVQQGTSKHYRGNTCVARGNLAWSSPLWVTEK